MTAKTKSKLKEDNDEPIDSTKTDNKPKPIIDFMEKWAKEEKCFREAILRDVNTKKIIEGGWPREKPTDQWAYENWLSKVVNQDTGNFFQQRNAEGFPIDRTGARHVITVMTRVRDEKGKNEYLLSKGSLIGYDAGGVEVKYPIAYPEKWRKTEFAYSRSYSEKTGVFTTQTTGPSKAQEVYELPFTTDNVQKLYERVEDENMMFVLKDLKTQEAREVKWSSVKDSLDLFCHKSWDFLWRGEYIPLPVRIEARQEAVAKGLIHGVASDYSMQSSGSTSAGVE